MENTPASQSHETTTLKPKQVSVLGNQNRKASRWSWSWNWLSSCGGNCYVVVQPKSICRVNTIYHKPSYSVRRELDGNESFRSDIGSSTEEEEDTSQVGQPWKTGIFDYHQNQTNALMTILLPCVTFGQITTILAGGETRRVCVLKRFGQSCALGSFMYLLMMPTLCSQWFMGAKNRAKLRNKYNLVEPPFGDCMSHLFCPCCFLCQEFRELQSRGMDPNLGWKEILAQQQAVPQSHQNQAECPPQDQSHQDQVQCPPQNQVMPE